MKFVKRILSTLLVLVFSFSLSITAFAVELDKTTTTPQEVASSVLIVTRDENGEVQFEVPSTEINPKIPGWANILKVSVADLGINKLRVSIQNLGLDWIDQVSMNIKIYNERGLQIDKYLTEQSIKQFLPRNNDYYVVGWNRIVITNIIAKDEGDVGYLNNIDYSK